MIYQTNLIVKVKIKTIITSRIQDWIFYLEVMSHQNHKNEI